MARPFYALYDPEDLNDYGYIEADDDEDDEDDVGEDVDADDILELFAVVCLDEENPPTYDPDERGEVAIEYLNIGYDPDEHLYCCEAVLVRHESLESITALTLDEALARGIDRLRTLLAAEAEVSGA